MEFGEGDGRGVEGATVEGAPFAIMDGLHLVRDHHMRVQMRVTRSRVVVIERRRDHPGHIRLRNRPIAPCRADTGCGNLTLDERNHLRNRRVMRVRNQRLRARVGHRPQYRCGLRNREREIEPSNRLPHPTSTLLSRDCGDRLGTLGHGKVGVEPRRAVFDALGHGWVIPILATERLIGHRVAALSNQTLKLQLRDLVASRDGSAAECDDG